VAQLEEIAKPLEAHRLLTRRRGAGSHAADAIDAARRCRAPVRTIVGSSAAGFDALAAPSIAERSSLIASRLRAGRRALAGRAVSYDARAAGSIEDRLSPPQSQLDAALVELEAVATGFAGRL
jgi:hypothetical protein